MSQIDVAIIGAGIEGLAIASAVTAFAPETYVFERNNSFGLETSSRSSEVLHCARVYYKPGSLKARLCSEGINQFYSLNPNPIPHKKIGKLIVANHELDLPKLETLFRTGLENGASSLRMIDRGEIKRLEPNINAVAAIYSPDTGIVDSHAFMSYFLRIAQDNAGINPVAYGSEVIGIDKLDSGFKITFRQRGKEESIRAKVVINSAGLASERVASMAGIDTKEAGYEIEFVKGEYFSVNGRHRGKTSHLVYPLPGALGLGIHSTLNMAGDMRLGPNAFKVSEIDYKVDKSKRRLFYDSVKSTFPFLNIDDLQPDTAGIRPKPKSGDFIIREESERGLPGLINLIGIESPGLTASLGIRDMVTEMVRTCLKQ